MLLNASKLDQSDKDERGTPQPQGSLGVWSVSGGVVSTWGRGQCLGVWSVPGGVVSTWGWAALQDSRLLAALQGVSAGRSPSLGEFGEQTSCVCPARMWAGMAPPAGGLEVAGTGLSSAAEVPLAPPSPPPSPAEEMLCGASSSCWVCAGSSAASLSSVASASASGGSVLQSGLLPFSFPLLPGFLEAAGGAGGGAEVLEAPPGFRHVSLLVLIFGADLVAVGSCLEEF